MKLEIHFYIINASICNEGLKAQLCKIVWTHKLDPEDFNQRWWHILNKFNLQDHKWLRDMFELRNNWIPAYFRDWAMSGLMRTSSRSESENHMFGQLMSASSTLLEFFTHFETAMQAQRFTQSKNDHESMYTTPATTPGVEFENDIVNLYTRTVFLGVQKDIQDSIKYCMSENVTHDEGVKTYTIVDTSIANNDLDDTIDRNVEPKYFDALIPTHSKV